MKTCALLFPPSSIQSVSRGYVINHCSHTGTLIIKIISFAVYNIVAAYFLGCTNLKKMKGIVKRYPFIYA